MTFDKYMDEWEEFEEFLKQRDDLDELKEKYVEIDEDFGEALFEQWDDMDLRCNWNSLTPQI